MIIVKVITTLEGKVPDVEHRVGTWLTVEHVGESISLDKTAITRRFHGKEQIVVNIWFKGTNHTNVRYIEGTLGEVLSQEFEAETHIEVQ